jgi:hypothetical protein
MEEFKNELRKRYGKNHEYFKHYFKNKNEEIG